MLEASVRWPRGMFFLPWVGRSFGESDSRWPNRLLVLGESHYRPRGRKHSRGFTRECVEHFGYGIRRQRFFTIVTQLITAKRWPTIRETVFAWDSVAFCNYIQDWVGRGPRRRPSDDQWRNAKTVFVQVVRLLEPTVILITGKELARHLVADDIFAPTKPREAWPWIGNVRVGRKTISALAVPHPAGSGSRSSAMIRPVGQLLARVS